MAKFNPNNHKGIQRLKRLYVIGEQERIIDVVQRHLAYLGIMFAAIIALYVVIILAGYVLLPNIFDDRTTAYRIMALVAMVMAILMALVMVIANYLFLQTKIIITNENLIQVLQKDLLHSDSSRIALTDIEGVYSNQGGYLATVFGYGKLTVETKGEQDFVFNYCPRPRVIAKELIDAKEKLISGVEAYSQD
jgi:hypothetical protein